MNELAKLTACRTGSNGDNFEVVCLLSRVSMGMDEREYSSRHLFAMNSAIAVKVELLEVDEQVMTDRILTWRPISIRFICFVINIHSEIILARRIICIILLQKCLSPGVRLSI